ncbi:hypothetical protein EDD27_3255 [Nonomuraea polychroma]|uniref:Uncharacterized protein n=1 Tax=Nonomuraea polychroma TaxID=46176 RepID=A0A438M4Z9_9ACTN|nr:hypothetical protein [Nonomuraea polychroma]RVX40822.1 hypothetical protein EDD27_3255 [Nonomuraea polychroma]
MRDVGVAPEESRPRRRTARWLSVGVVLLAVAGGLLTVMNVDVPPPPGEYPAEEPTETPSPAPLRVTLDPPRVPAGTDAVRVSASCQVPTAFVVSDAFPYNTALEPTAGGGVSGEVELERNISPGTYRVLVSCEDGSGSAQVGSAELVITKGPATPTPSAQARIATTYVTLAQAQPDAWRAHPSATATAGGDEPDDIPYVFTVTHELRVPADDPDVAAMRSGAAARYPDMFAVTRLGWVTPDSNSSRMPIVFAAPVVRLERGASEAVVTFTGRTYGFADPDDGGLIGVDFSPPDGEDMLPLTAHEIVVSATGWTVSGTRGSPPLSQDRHHLRMNARSSMRAAFLRDGQTGSVAGYLLDGGAITSYIEGSEPDSSPEEQPEVELLPRSWTALQTVSEVAAWLALLYALVRALGGAWWRRRRNWVCAAMPLAVSVLLVVLSGSGFLEGGSLAVTAMAVLTFGLPLLSVVSAARALSDTRPTLVGAGAVALAGIVLLLWALWMLTGNAVVLWGPVAVAVATGVVAAVPRWRRALPVVALGTLAVGALMAGRIAVDGIVPGHAVWFALYVVFMSVLAIGWVTEASHRWSTRTAAACAVAVPVPLGVVYYAASSEWTTTHMTADQLESILTPVYFFATYGVLLLALAALLVRVRRIGQESAALTSTIAFHTAVFFLLMLSWQAAGSTEYFGPALLLAWAGIAWLLPRADAAGPAALTPVSATEHRTLVRDMIRRRSVRLSLTGLLRQGPASDGSPAAFEEQRAALERAGDEHAGPLDSDYALATVAGRTPWQNALAALAMGTLLSLPFSTVRIIVSADTWRSGSTDALTALLALISLPALCMIFGYFYPRVRGDNPIAKSMALLVAALLVELPVYVQTLAAVTATPPSTTAPVPAADEALIGTLVAVGNIAVVSIGLGLWWEWRLMRLAGEPWARIRSIRTLRTLGPPLAAAAIAIATTAATALVNNVIAPLPTAQVGEAGNQSTPSPTPRP